MIPKSGGWFSEKIMLKQKANKLGITASSGRSAPTRAVAA